MLARVWVSDPDMLLLDEPTNHLDLARISQLEEWLNALPRDIPVVIASHDRAFLDATTNRTLFLRPEHSHAFSLPYAQARAALDEVDSSEQRRYQQDLKTAQQLRRQAAKLSNIGINSGSDLLVVKTKQLKQRAERLEDAARPGHQERSSGAIKLANRGTHARILVTLNDAPVETPDGTVLFRTGKRWINQGDRIVVLGRNGAGKSRLISLIRTAIEQPDASAQTVRATPSLVLGYSDQGLSDARRRRHAAGSDQPALRGRRPARPQPACRRGAGDQQAGQAHRQAFGRAEGAAGDAGPSPHQSEFLSPRRTDQPSRHRGPGSPGGRAAGA